jgi:hypothetical protein
MPNQSFNIKLYKGNVNKDLAMNYFYTFRQNTNAENEYPTLKKTNSGTVVVDHNYGLIITEGFDKSRVFIGTRVWNQFVTLFDKSVSLISENLLEIFPDVNNSEFEIDQRALERFQTEKACSVAGMTIIPCVWIDQSQQCYPALRIQTLKESCVVPLEDAISMRVILNNIDPISYGFQTMQLMRMLFK